MIHILYFEVTDTVIHETNIHELIKRYPEEERDRILRFRFKKDQLLSAIGMKMVEQKFGNLAGWQRTELGKPFLDKSNIKFSISHSGDYVVAAFSQIQEVGLDIEQQNVLDFSDFTPVFREEEIEAFEDVKDFFNSWTMKEAVIKVLGTGFTLDARSLYLDHDNMTCKNQGEWLLKRVQIHEGYSCCLAMQIGTEEDLYLSKFTL